MTPTARPPFLRVPQIHTCSCGKDQARNPQNSQGETSLLWRARCPASHRHRHTHILTLTHSRTLKADSWEPSSSSGLAPSVLPLVRALSLWPNLLSFLGPLTHLPHLPRTGCKFVVSGVFSLANITRRQNHGVVRSRKSLGHPLGFIGQLRHQLAVEL